MIDYLFCVLKISAKLEFSLINVLLQKSLVIKTKYLLSLSVRKSQTVQPTFKNS